MRCRSPRRPHDEPDHGRGARPAARRGSGDGRLLRPAAPRAGGADRGVGLARLTAHGVLVHRVDRRNAVARDLGGNWHEYFFNGEPFYSLLPDAKRYPPFAWDGVAGEALPALEQDEDGEGPRTPSMSIARIGEDPPELLHAAEILIDSGARTTTP